MSQQAVLAAENGQENGGQAHVLFSAPK